ncbi:lectin subunit alpha-like [Musca autumnalis]|uniref:lectin subunit alpha-like n=1 Tax=Musca autumnalis TaxID=221902 RepID=UPI003CE95AE1
MKVLKVIAVVFCVLTLLWTPVDAVSPLQREITGGSYYIEYDWRYNWFEASHACARMGMKLVEIQDYNKQADVERSLRASIGDRGIFWIGANDEYKSSSRNRPFYWSSSGARVIFTHWMRDEPNNYHGGQHCISMENFEWNDKGCTESFGFICEKI